MHRLFAAVCLGALAWPACSSKSSSLPTQVVGASDATFEQLLTFVADDMRSHGVPGAALAIVRDGSLQVSAGLGYERAGGTATVQPTTTRFRVASLSKMVAAATAMTFVEAQQLDLTAPVTHWVPLAVTSGDATAITAQQLLDHSSGLPDLDDLTCAVGPGQLAAYLQAHPQPLWSPPGALYDYSNRGFSVLGWVIEALAGQPFEDVVAARLFAPLGMTTATYDVATALAGDHAFGHQQGQPQDLDAYDCAAQHPPAGILATVDDYARFAAMLLADGDTVLQPASVAAMEAVHIDTDSALDGAQGYGDGLAIFTGSTATMAYHNGDLPGFGSAIWLFPGRGFAVVVFYNSSDQPPSDVARRAAQLYLGDAITDGPSGVPPASEWTQYVGRYVDANELGQVDATLDDSGQLRLANSGAQPNHTFDGTVPLQPVGGDSFTATGTGGGSVDVTFFPSASERSHWLVTRHGVAERQ